MKLFKFFFVLIVSISTIHTEYIVFKHTGTEILPITDLQEHSDIYTILQTYQWPILLRAANQLDKKALAELSKFGSEAAEEKFLRKKIKELSPEYEIAFIPTIIYEALIISLQESRHALAYCPIEDIIYISRTLSRCSLLAGMDQQIAQIVKNPTRTVQDIYDYYNTFNVKTYISQLHMIINYTLLKFLFLTTSLSRTGKVQDEIDTNINAIFQAVVDSKPTPWQVRYLYNDNARKKFISLEYEARKKNFGILYRGGKAREIYIIGTKKTETPIEGSFLATKRPKSVPPRPAPIYPQLEIEYRTKSESTKVRDWNLPLNSVSYGNSIFAGFFCDSDSTTVTGKGACACDFLNFPDLIGYALFINKEKYISGKLDFLFIPSLNTITSMMASGEFFHARTKAFVPKEYFLKNQGEIDVPGIFFRQTVNNVTKGLIDNSEIFGSIGDPLEKAKDISEFIQLSARILKLPDDDGGFNAKHEAEISYRKAQIDLTDMLKAMITIRKQIRQKKESGN
ncbi:hypothetical protein M1446_05130 [Candidatus Dependentiae bacterium]|nr:hypothetical protein [Candidatus Dependentiae bacterium]